MAWHSVGTVTAFSVTHHRMTLFTIATCSLRRWSGCHGRACPAKIAYLTRAARRQNDW